MNNKIVILLVWLILPLIFQFDSHLSSGQLDTRENLNGIWERSDDYGGEDQIQLNQEGNRITASYEPTGGCWEDMVNKTPDPPYAETKIDFTGELTGNIIQGKVARCFPDESAIKSVDMKLTVSNDGKTLDGYAIGANGEQVSLSYVFVSMLVNEPSIEVSTNKPNYNLDESVDVSGRIRNIGQESQVLIEVNDPVGKQLFSRFVLVDSDGSFFTSFDFKNILINGTYTAFAIYPNATGKNSADFEYGLPSKGFSAADIGVPTGTIAALGAGGIFLYKHGYFKRIEQLFNNGSQNQETPDLPVVYVGVECGLENPELPKKPDFRNEIGPDLARLEQRFSKAVDDILKNRKVIKNVQKDIDFIKWCKEAKENPNKILSKVSDDIINKFLSSISPYFGNLILNELSIESDVSVTRDKHKKIRKSVQFSLVPIEPYIEFVLYINTQRVSSAKFIFTIETNVEVKNLTVNMTSPDTNVEEVRQERPGQDYDKKISIESLIFAIAVEFSRLKIALIEKNITPPIMIGTKKIELKKFGSTASLS